MKRIGTILLAAGIFMLIAAILFAMSTGGLAATILIIGSIILNSAGVMLLTVKKK